MPFTALPTRPAPAPVAGATATSGTDWLLVALLSALLWAAPAHAHGPAHAGANLDAVETAFGRTGDPDKVTRTVQVEMLDAMRFKPDRISVRQGDTLRIVVRNRGRILHELVIGTDDELRRHAALMRANPDMEHDAPYMSHVEPGRRGEIVWQFTQLGEFRFGCLVPGHFEAGMAGTIVVTPRR
jgi:uncharacterized cupredoxin-like copper-binding protein